MASKKQTIVLFKQQSARGTGVALSGTTDAFVVLEEGFSAGHDFDNVEVKQLDGTLNAPDILTGSSVFQLDLAVGLVGSGTAGAAPKFAPMLKAGGFVENLITVAPLRAEYTLGPTPGSSIGGSAAVYMGDQLLPGRDVFCDAELSIEVNSIGKIAFKCQGVLNGDVTAAALPSVTIAKPLPLPGGPTNTSKISIGNVGAVTYTAGAIAGGTAMAAKSISVKAGCKVEKQPWLGAMEVDISDSTPSVSMSVDMSAAEYATMFVRQRDSAGFSFGVKHVLSAAGADIPGRTAVIHAPNAKIKSLKKSDEYNGRVIATIEAALNPSAPGLKDALRLAFL